MTARRRAVWGLVSVAVAVTAWAPGAGRAAGEAYQVGVVVPRYVVAGGQDVTVYAQVRDASGTPMPDGTLVAFSATLGASLDPSQAQTIGGVAATRLAVGTEAGFLRLDAMSGRARGDAVLWVRPAAAARITGLVADPPGVFPEGQTRLRARLVDAFGNPADGDRVTWSAVGGTVSPAEGRVEIGLAQATFTAGDAPGEGEVRVATGNGLSAALAVTIGDWGRPAPGMLAFLPSLARATGSGATCRDVLANGSFERDGDGDGVPDAWQLDQGGGSAGRVGDDTLFGRWSLRLTGATGVAPLARQELDLPGGARAAGLKLWVRGADDGAEMWVAVWSIVDVAGRPTRVPVVVRREPVAGPGWVPLAVALPVVPRGPTTIELAPRAPHGGTVTLAVDAVRLMLCR